MESWDKILIKFWLKPEEIIFLFKRAKARSIDNSWKTKRIKNLYASLLNHRLHEFSQVNMPDNYTSKMEQSIN